MDGGLAHLVEVETRIARRALERGDERLGSRLGGAIGKRGERGVDNVDARHRSHQVDHVARTAGVVRVQMDGDADGLLEALDKGVGVHRQQQVGHVLDAESVRAHLLELLGELDEVILIVNGRDRVGERSLDLTAVLFRGLDGLLQVAHIVERIENADDVDAVFDGPAAELVHDVIGIMLVA